MNLRPVVVLFVGLLLVSANALSQIPLPPVNLTVQQVPGSLAALLQWDASSLAQGYRVFRAVDTSSHFANIGNTQSTTFTDHMIQPGRTYRYHVRAFNQAGISAPSNIVIYTPPSPTPPISGWITGTVVDDSTGLPIGGVRVAFVRISTPNLASRIVHTNLQGEYFARLDTGLYYINASKMGYRSEWYDDVLHISSATPVHVAAGDTSTANFGLAPLFPPPPHVTGTLTGTVIDDSSGLPLAGARIRLYRPSGFFHPAHGMTDSLGMYSIQADTGRYLVYATKFGYRAEWYDDSPTVTGATPVLIQENQTTTANFGLAPMHPTPPLLVSVSGTVTDSISGQPIAGALVAIMRTPQTLATIADHNALPFGYPNEIVNLTGHGLSHGVAWRGFTDSTGSYTGRVRAGFTYIVYSSAIGYVPEFYDNKPSAFHADRLTLHSDTSGIDFDLRPRPNLQNSIAGMVIDTAGNGVLSHVVLFVVTDSLPRPVRHVRTDSLGNYVFQFVHESAYFLKALPHHGYAPAWYKAGAFGVNNWQDADTVIASGHITGIDIGVIPVEGGGLGRITGRIADNNNNPIVGAVVYARAPGANGIYGYYVTEHDGEFALSNLPPGTVRVVVDREGYTAASPRSYELTSSNNFEAANQQFFLTPSTPLWEGTAPSPIPSSFKLEQNFPNPFNPSTEIQFGLPEASHVRISVYNLLGQNIVTLVEAGFSPGLHRVVWDGKDARGTTVAGGIYFYKIVATPEATHRPLFQQVRRMVLLK